MYTITVEKTYKKLNIAPQEETFSRFCLPPKNAARGYFPTSPPVAGTDHGTGTSSAIPTAKAKTRHPTQARSQTYAAVY